MICGDVFGDERYREKRLSWSPFHLSLWYRRQKLIAKHRNGKKRCIDIHSYRIGYRGRLREIRGEKSLKPPKKFACCSSAVEILRKHVRNSLIKSLRHAFI